MFRAFYFIAFSGLGFGAIAGIETSPAQNRERDFSLKSDSAIFHEADQYFDAMLYDNSIPLYQQLLQAILVGHYQESEPHVRYRLAQALFLTERYGEAAAVLQDAKDSISRSELYLLALAQAKLERYPDAVASLKKVLAPSEPFPLAEQAQYEMGLAYFKWGKLNEAKEQFTFISDHCKLLTIKCLSIFYLVRIDLAENKTDHAEGLLDTLEPLLEYDDLLRYELSFLYGEVNLQKEEYQKAIEHFEKALTKKKSEQMAWHWETLYRLGWSYLKAIHDLSEKSDASMGAYLKKAEMCWTQILEHKPDERALLALGQCYLSKARYLKDVSAYQQAETVLSRQDILISREAQAHALLLRAEAAATYAKRDALYRHLTQDAHKFTPYYAKGWYLRGLNDLEEGQKLAAAQQTNEADQAFERAIISLKQAFNLLKTHEPACAGLACKYQAQALFYQQSKEKSQEALATLYILLNKNIDVLQAMGDPDEIYYLHAQIAAHIADWLVAENSLVKGLSLYPKGSFADAMILLRGTISYSQGKYEEAEAVFVKLSEDYPSSPLAGESLFWAARCADNCQNTEKSKQYRRRVFEQFSKSPFAPEAYFSYYNYYDYLQGDRAAIKHLESLPEKYAQTPYLIHAWYLIGLDYKRDRKTPEGKWIRKKNLTAAIDAFQEVESAFDLLKDEGKLPAPDLNYLTSIRYRAMLERSLANLAIAEESQGAKRQVYLEYAQELFQKICHDFKNPDHPLSVQLKSSDECEHIQEEAGYWLAQAYIKDNKKTLAEQELNEMLEKYQSAKITRGYFLSRIWYEKGLLAEEDKNYPLALTYYAHAEDASKGKILSTNQKLELWIQQSNCHRTMHDYDTAIILLSKVINDDAVSGLRIKAMYLRAELYELQDRREVARRQLEATSKKGGEWAQKAKIKLENMYGL